MVIRYFDPAHQLEQITGQHAGQNLCPDFISKLAIVEEEADETLFWLELIGEMKVLKMDSLYALMKENDEIISVIVSSIKTARKSK